MRLHSTLYSLACVFLAVADAATLSRRGRNYEDSLAPRPDSKVIGPVRDARDYKLLPLNPVTTDIDWDLFVKHKCHLNAVPYHVFLVLEEPEVDFSNELYQGILVTKGPAKDGQYFHLETETAGKKPASNGKPPDVPLDKADRRRMRGNPDYAAALEDFKKDFAEDQSDGKRFRLVKQDSHPLLSNIKDGKQAAYPVYKARGTLLTVEAKAAFETMLREIPLPDPYAVTSGSHTWAKRVVEAGIAKGFIYTGALNQQRQY